MAGLLLAGFVLAGCADLVAGPRLVESRSSPEALAEAALEALAASDDDGLARLVVTREEYETLLWPSLPDRDYVTFDFVWGMSQPRTRKARRGQLSEYGGLPLELVRVERGTEKEVYDHFTLHKDVQLVVRNARTGVEGRIPLMDVLLEMDGRWKFLNFRDDF